MKKGYFTKFEIIFYLISITIMVLSFFIFQNNQYLYLFNSICGITSLILIAKGNPIGQILTIVFSLIYGFISISYQYYGEMITYICMTLPMAIFSFISWIRNPYEKDKNQVKTQKLSWFEYLIHFIITAFITIIFYFVLKVLNTNNLIISTISIFTSFLASSLTFRRSKYYAISYAVNDIVLIILWILASLDDISYLSVVLCFVFFFISDIYGFINWCKMERKQHNQE